MATTRQLWRNLLVLLVAIAVVVGLLKAVPGLRGVGRTLSRISPGWLVLAVVLEILSCLGYVIAFQQVFRRVPQRTAAGVAWSELAFQTVFPAGGAGGLAFGS